MKLEIFLQEKRIEYQKYLWKQEIMASQEYKDTSYKYLLLDERMKSFQENPDIPFSFKDEYLNMISLLNFVFPNIPKDRYTERSYLFLTEDETEKYDKIQESKDEEIFREINEDSRKCFCLLSYLFLMKASVLGSKICNVEKEIRELFHSFTERFHQYQYKIIRFDKGEEKNDDHNQRKTHPNKGELLDGLYERVFIKRSENVSEAEKAQGITPYLNEEEKSIICFLRNIDPDEQGILFSAEQRIIDQLVHNDRSELDETQKAEKAYAKCKKMMYAVLGDELLNEAARLNDHYESERDWILSCRENPPVREIAFKELNPEEIDFINYLYQLYYSNCEKYNDMDKSENHDIKNPKNSRRWDILDQEERETLAAYIENLCDDDQTLLKYIREKDFMKEDKKHSSCGAISKEEKIIVNYGTLGGVQIWSVSDQAKEMIYSLVASIKDDPYYHTFKRLERLFQFIQAAPNSLNIENPDIKRLYSDLEAKIKNADSIYFKLMKCRQESILKKWLKGDE